MEYVWDFGLSARFSPSNPSRRARFFSPLVGVDAAEFHKLFRSPLTAQPNEMFVRIWTIEGLVHGGISLEGH